MGDEVWKKVSYKKRRAGFDKSELPSIQNKQYMGIFRSKEDDLEKIFVSVFINNIPDSCSAKELFNACKQYGHVVDSFIPNKRSKAGKRFGFVKFINVFNEERLVDNLGTVWIGRYRIHANLAKFRRPTVGEAKKVGYENVGSKSNRGHVEVDKGTNVPISSAKSPAGSFVNAVKGNPPMPDLPSLVLDESLEVDIIKKTENQAKMTKLSMEWKKTVQNQGQSPKMPKSESILKISAVVNTGAGTEVILLNAIFTI
ncbi:RNA-directed DNA polymerase, eukaryota [Tanacetum coccineum]|uniref:RNA-directed DNA polymerase, eukaryota n=1 Tax=Tanacetum coccineum TaxID=301880 RepID=A0ABQ5AM71_9ASTR